MPLISMPLISMPLISMPLVSMPLISMPLASVAKLPQLMKSPPGTFRDTAAISGQYTISRFIHVSTLPINIVLYSHD
jgi:hypothetical protein